MKSYFYRYHYPRTIREQKRYYTTNFVYSLKTKNYKITIKAEIRLRELYKYLYDLFYFLSQ